ncbi:hypothetical protein [Phenylobacterium sp.]|jgi:TRAP-type C4-dicarboxylate transport system substrate-binding protein|uniref:hypothetical protein n=1 Tax=Phenylobacterium sp. TaxID=1871053 RepID=UPI002F933A7F
MRLIASSLFLAAALAAGAAAAEPPQARATEAAEALAQRSEPLALTAEEMESASGGQGISVEVLTRQQLSGTTSGNTVTAGTLTSGDVSFGADALDGFSGVGNFVINTGANNTLQGAINISVVTTPAR